VIAEMMRKNNGDKRPLEGEVLNHSEDILVHPKDAVIWLRQKIAELEEDLL
jgi:hypothetical protein